MFEAYYDAFRPCWRVSSGSFSLCEKLPWRVSTLLKDLFRWQITLYDYWINKIIRIYIYSVIYIKIFYKIHIYNARFSSQFRFEKLGCGCGCGCGLSYHDIDISSQQWDFSNGTRNDRNSEELIRNKVKSLLFLRKGMNDLVLQ